MGKGWLKDVMCPHQVTRQVDMLGPKRWGGLPHHHYGVSDWTHGSVVCVSCVHWVAWAPPAVMSGDWCGSRRGGGDSADAMDV